MTNKNRLRKILNAINKFSLRLEAGEKKWFCYRLVITDLFWGRNLCDGWDIEVFHKTLHIGTIRIDGNLGQVHIDYYEKYKTGQTLTLDLRCEQ